MRRAAAALALLELLAHLAEAAMAQEAARVMTLVLPRPLAEGAQAWIDVQLGRLGPGQEIDVTTATGRDLGTISPFGMRAGQAAGTFTLPVPADAIVHGRLTIRLAVTQAGASRAPTADEVRGVTLKVAPR